MSINDWPNEIPCILELFKNIKERSALVEKTLIKNKCIILQKYLAS